MVTKQLSISEFKAHCTEEIRGVEKGDTIIELTRHGKKVAVVQTVLREVSPPDLASWMGSGRGMVAYGPGYDASASAWEASDWES
ncbi:type II toxin-antitoxin system Phd/YefM family antitoxin [Luteolibacter yonseiensis]|uniref:Type II toxin-antitoxin system Phd/YefM family antitoxin n=1 Tax=Luteolibacter yonseiensis TaxID=1144680 RepID=A0A934V6V4_9BACT|nr:type II toxin-antitoxin system Phd/YefM family antitoxin [Luteolibacter yonseiensis]MBK1815452.1 type II toxin-antitoxin system Phd/YefM family antitoxin [Luteolibacter yonseiensis]